MSVNPQNVGSYIDVKRDMDFRAVLLTTEYDEDSG